MFRPPSHHEALSAIPRFVAGYVCAAAQATNPLRGLFLLRAPIDKLSILPVCGFNGTSFVEVADIFL